MKVVMWTTNKMHLKLNLKKFDIQNEFQLQIGKFEMRNHLDHFMSDYEHVYYFHSCPRKLV